jgi:succinate dehydrogenase / fumarate reductase membrane anchor subunit
MSADRGESGIGSKRLVVGAHYGIGAWLFQRLTAVVMGLYFIALVIYVLIKRDFTYIGWAEMFAPLWMKAVTLIVIGSLLYHAWIGMRDIWMDYIKPTWLRLSLQMLTVLWLLACAVWSVQILWRV